MADPSEVEFRWSFESESRMKRASLSFVPAGFVLRVVTPTYTQTNLVRWDAVEVFHFNSSPANTGVSVTFKSQHDKSDGRGVQIRFLHATYMDAFFASACGAH